VLIALDRMERVGADAALSSRSAVEEFTQAFGIPVLPLATLEHLLRYLSTTGDAALASHLDAVLAYRERYGV
jgi:orotate phosphoribosyltransferase